MKALYGLTVALSAFLLFSVEPMVTRALLPQLGGTSAVWISALAFFQLALLAGYAYTLPVALASARRPTIVALHLLVLVLALASLFAPSHTAADEVTSGLAPQLKLFVLLGTRIGLPFAVLSTTAPLLQAWYTRREQAPVPYRLFALSNLASFAALIAYPALLEPTLGLDRQFALWKAGFAVYVLCAGLLTVRMRQAHADPRDPVDAPAAATPIAQAVRARKLLRRTHLLWLLLPAVASAQLAAVTAHLTQDVASVPLLWVVPLGAYLLSFVLAFDLERIYRRTVVTRMLAVLLFALGYFLTRTGFNVPIGVSIVLFTAELFFAAWFCHAELFALRPANAEESSRFYLFLAAGGALGTLAVAVLSPLVTSANYDLPLAFALTAGVAVFALWEAGVPHRLLWFAGVGFGLYVLVVVHQATLRDTLLTARNFYGSIRVKQSEYPPQAYLSRQLYNGAIEHGMQWFSTEFHHAPLTYYTQNSGVGLALTHGGAQDRPRHIGVIGLGAGTLAAYGRPGDSVRFYEINPVVTDVAEHLFTFTRDTPATVSIIPGDARLSLAAEPTQQFDLLAVDAFSGDSIPTHLLTREAMAIYLRHLAPKGVLAFHISNQYLDLAPVLARQAEALQEETHRPWTAREIDSGPDAQRGEALASWVLLTEDPVLFAQPDLARASKPVATQPDVKLWTDQYSSLLPILRWSGRHIAAK